MLEAAIKTNSENESALVLGLLGVIHLVRTQNFPKNCFLRNVFLGILRIFPEQLKKKKKTLANEGFGTTAVNEIFGP